ncbi:MAG: tetratricopeptide repeat protein, partial [Thiogranum sp.]
SQVYIGRQNYYDRLDAHAQGTGTPLVVLGESGSGKSALLANWAFRFRKANPDTLLIQHYIGSTLYSADWASMLQRILGELIRHFDIKMEIPDTPDALHAAFANALHMAAARGKVVLILDALNQLGDRDQARDLVWMPPEIPENIRLVVSTLPGRVLEGLERRSWPSLQVEPLIDEERRQLVNDYLAQYTKSLSSTQLQQIVIAPQTANPLYLRTLLEELRLFGRHEELNQKIRYYLEAKEIHSLYEKILHRYETDYEHDRPGLVRDTMTYLWASRRGLSEAELLDLLGSDNEPLPHACWSPLFLAAEQALVRCSGLLNFAHGYLRQAVQSRYVYSEVQQQAAHTRLADYFEQEALNPRSVDELPWQLAQSRNWKRLHDRLADLPFIMAALDTHQFEVRGFWVEVETRASLSMVIAYRKVLYHPKEHIKYLWNIANLFDDMGHSREAFILQNHLFNHYRKLGDNTKLSDSLGRLARIYSRIGETDKAMAAYHEQERLYRKSGDGYGLLQSYGNRAVLLQQKGSLEEAMSIHKESEKLYRELDDKDGLSKCLNNQGLILRNYGDLGRALKLFLEAEQLCRDLGDKEGLGRSLGNQGLIFNAMGEIDKAMGRYKMQEELCRKLGDKIQLAISLGNQAIIHEKKGELDLAMVLYQEQFTLCGESGDINGLCLSLANRALLLFLKLNKPDEALPLAQEGYNRAMQHGMNALADQIKPILDAIQKSP